MLPAVFSKAALAVLPVAGGPVSSLLVPALAYLITQREVEIHIAVR